MQTSTIESPHEAPSPLPPGWLSQWPWVTFVIPFFVFGLVTPFEPSPPQTAANAKSNAAVDGLESIGTSDSGEVVENEFVAAERQEAIQGYRRYPYVYTLKIALTVASMLLVWRGYRTFPWRWNPLAVFVGIVGVVVWIGLCKLRLEPIVLGPLGLSDYFRDLGQRSAFNPLVELAGRPLWAYGFLAIRFFGLACVVPIIEKFFLRDFVMRLVVHDRWECVPFGTVTPMAVVAGSLLPMLSHPGELFAAMAWFSMVSWLMIRTRNLWDCVVAHGVTNLLLGLYVVTITTTESWRLM